MTKTQPYKHFFFFLVQLNKLSLKWMIVKVNKTSEKKNPQCKGTFSLLLEVLHKSGNFPFAKDTLTLLALLSKGWDWWWTNGKGRKASKAGLLKSYQRQQELWAWVPRELVYSSGSYFIFSHAFLSSLGTGVSFEKKTLT